MEQQTGASSAPEEGARPERPTPNQGEPDPALLERLLAPVEPARAPDPGATGRDSSDLDSEAFAPGEKADGKKPATNHHAAAQVGLLARCADWLKARQAARGKEADALKARWSAQQTRRAITYNLAAKEDRGTTGNAAREKPLKERREQHTSHHPAPKQPVPKQKKESPGEPKNTDPRRTNDRHEHQKNNPQKLKEQHEKHHKPLLDKHRQSHKEKHDPGPKGPGGRPGADPHRRQGPAKTKPEAPTKHEKEKPGKPGTTRQKTDADPIKTRPMRTTGYRDGNRVGAGASAARAYRDGFKDGLKKQRDDYTREKKAMDNLRKAPPKPGQDPKKPVKPLGATPDASGGVKLSDDAARGSLSSGEVKRLSTYQRALTRKTRFLTAKADDAKLTVAACQHLQTRVRQLTEGARQADIGEKTQRALAVLSENAGLLLARAEKQQELGDRAAEQARAIHDGVNARYEQIHKAVADAGRTAPAHMSHYKE